MIYLIVLILIIFLTLKYPRLNVKGNIAYKFLCVLFIFISGFRYNVGLDTMYYTAEFQNFPELRELSWNFIQNSNYQILWILFESSIRSISESFYVLQFVLACFVNIVVFNSIKKHSVNPFFSILFYFLLFYANLNMEILRESIPICFFLLGVELILKKKYLFYYLLSIVGYFFHESAIILFIVPILLVLKMNRKSYLVVISVFLIFAGFLSIYLINNLEVINFLFNENKLDYFDQNETSFSNQAFNIIKYVIVPTIVLFLFYSKLSELERKMIFSYILFSILFTQFFIFYRIRDYFFIFFLIALTNGFVQNFKVKLGQKTSVFKPIFLTVFLFSFLYRFYYIAAPQKHYQSYLNYYPYTSVLDEEIPPSRVENMKQIKK